MQRDVAREPVSGMQGFDKPPAALTSGSESNIIRLPRLRQQTQVVKPRLINPDPPQRLTALKRRHHDIANQGLAGRVENATGQNCPAGRQHAQSEATIQAQLGNAHYEMIGPCVESANKQPRALVTMTLRICAV